MTKGQKIAIGIGLLFVGLAIKATARAQRLAAIFSEMTIRPYGIPRQVKLVGLKELSFTIDVILANPTGEDFAVAGYVAVLKEVIIDFRGQFLGSARMEVEEIAIPAHGTLVLRDIRIVIGTNTVINNLYDLYGLLQGGDLDWDDLRFRGIIDAPGGPYEIG